MKKILLLVIGCALSLYSSANTPKDELAESNAQTVTAQSGKQTITFYVRNMEAEGRVLATTTNCMPIDSDIWIQGVAFTLVPDCGSIFGFYYVEYVETFEIKVPAGEYRGHADLPLMCDVPQRIIKITNVSLSKTSDAYANYEVVLQ